MFLFRFLPALLALYFLTRAVAALFKIQKSLTGAAAMAELIAASAFLIVWNESGRLLLAAMTLTFVLAAVIDRIRAREGSRTVAFALLMIAVGANVAAFAFLRWQSDGRTFAFVGVSVLTCHAVAYVIDVYRGEASAGHPLTSALYLVQFPVLPAGPIVRSRDFSRSHLKVEEGVGLGAFTYGVRRLIIGLVKVILVAGTLGGPSDAIFALPAARLSTDAAWLGAVCFALEIYFRFSGFADIAIGLGRMFGFRYPENFRRPYVADSVREFWRRWNITSIMWLRDYLSLPIAGRAPPSPRLFVNIVLGFCLVGLWHGAGTNVLVWALYSGVWLALEAIGLGARMERLPAPVRHAYTLGVVVVGWVILRAGTNAHALAFLQTMAGLHGASVPRASPYLTLEVWTALVVAVVGAGPLVPWISRWRVTLDAATADLVMMMTAVSLFVWRGGALLLGVAFHGYGEAPRLPRRPARKA